MNFFTHLFTGFWGLALKVFLAYLGLGLFLGLLGFAGEILFYFFYPIYFITLRPALWAVKSVNKTRCPKCRGFFKRKILRTDVIEEKEILKSVPRTETGVLYSNHFLEPNQAFEITREAQVPHVKTSLKSYWQCKDPLCAHQWTTERTFEYEGELSHKPAPEKSVEV